MRFSYLAVLGVVLAVLGIGSKESRAQTTVKSYEFGFNIEEQQHRHEQRDERGIVKGEFGFITADGIYHVTVYATDEEGKFRILAMRNYPYENPPKTIDMIVASKPTVRPTTPPPSAPNKIKLLKHTFNTEACSGCFLKNSKPTPSPAEEEVKSDKVEIRPLSKELELIEPNSIEGNTPLSRPLSQPKSSPGIANIAKTQPLSKKPPSVTPSGSPLGLPMSVVKAVLPTLSQAINGGGGSVRKPSAPSSGSVSKIGSSNIGSSKIGSNNIGSSKIGSSNIGSSKIGSSNIGSSKIGSSSTGGSNIGSSNIGKAGGPKGAAFGGQQGGILGGLGNKGSSGSPGNIGGGIKGSVGESGDLYRFKYILDLNGHTETGSRNGNKVGTYYAIGDDNVERTIEYIANESGFQPRIRWRKLDADTAAKLRENTLKEYEFVWFN